MSIKSYKELMVWKKSIELVKEIYQQSELLPKHETYGLRSQMRRAAVSVPSNIAEGYQRKSRKEYIQFLNIANASTAELGTQVTISKDLYPHIDFGRSEALLEEIQKMLFVLIEKLHPIPYSLTPIPYVHKAT